MAENSSTKDIVKIKSETDVLDRIKHEETEDRDSKEGITEEINDDNCVVKTEEEFYEERMAENSSTKDTVEIKSETDVFDRIKHEETGDSDSKEGITEEINDDNCVVKTEEEFYEERAKKEHAVHKREAMKTGGGAPPKEETQETYSVLSILSQEVVNPDSEFDSDAAIVLLEDDDDLLMATTATSVERSDYLPYTSSTSFSRPSSHCTDKLSSSSPQAIHMAPIPAKAVHLRAKTRAKFQDERADSYKAALKLQVEEHAMVMRVRQAELEAAEASNAVFQEWGRAAMSVQEASLSVQKVCRNANKFIRMLKTTNK